METTHVGDGMKYRQSSPASWRGAGAVMGLSLLSACGGSGGGAASAPAPSPTVTPSPAPTATATPPATFQTTEYFHSDGPAFHNAIPAWSLGAAGKGVTIGIVDTGIDSTSPEFAGRIAAASTDLAGTRGLSGGASHGTQVAMVAAAARNNTGVVGIAWDATILALRADRPGSCATADPTIKDSGCQFDDAVIAASVDHAVQNGAKVINISLGGSAPDQVVRDAIARAGTANVVVIVSAGNDGASTKTDVDPANPDPFAAGLRTSGNGNVIIAGSVDANGAFSSFSNRAGAEQQWFLSARGEQICCVYQNGALKETIDANGQRYVTLFSGTSYSAPQVAGAVALLRQYFPNLTATQVVDLLLKTARDAGTTGTDATYGRGIMDIGAAFTPQGTTSIAGTTAQLPLGDTTLVASAAMGDAVQQASLGTMVLDRYQRAFQVELGGALRSAQLQPRLAAALAGQVRQITGGNAGVALAFAVDGRPRAAALPWAGALRLNRDDSDRAHVLAARLITRMGPQTSFALAYAQGADGLVAQLRGQNADQARPAFLVASDPAEDFGFSRSGQTAFALRRAIGAWGLSFSAERGSAISGAPAQFAYGRIERNRRDGVTRLGLSLDRSLGALDAALGASWLSEDRTMLGAHLHDSFGASGADSLFLDAGLGWQAAPRFHLGARWRQGLTRARGSAMVLGSSSLITQGWALDASRLGLFVPGDSLSLRLSQPLRVSRGGIDLNLPFAWNYETLTATQSIRQLSLTPTGRELTGELAWRGPMGGGTGRASLFWRHNPGHYARLPADKGVGFNWVKGF